MLSPRTNKRSSAFSTINEEKYNSAGPPDKETKDHKKVRNYLQEQRQFRFSEAQQPANLSLALVRAQDTKIQNIINDSTLTEYDKME